MPATKNQLKRLDIIDELLSRKKWGVYEILERINSKLEKSIDKRTLFRDIQYLIEEKDAPIHRPGKSDPFYYYTEKYSIKSILLDLDEVSVLRKSIDLLKEAGKFPFLADAELALRKLENKLNSAEDTDRILVQFENHTAASGDNWFEELYEAIYTKTSLLISYHPFKVKAAQEKIVHPYFLKEYRNRWFLFGRDGNYNTISIFALDRIKKCKPSKEAFIENDLFDPRIYFKHLIGVSLPLGSKIEKILLKVDSNLSPYIISKPLHSTQTILKQLKSGDIQINLEIIINYEFKSILLGFGDSIEVIKPVALRHEIREMITKLAHRYNQ